MSMPKEPSARNWELSSTVMILVVLVIAVAAAAGTFWYLSTSAGGEGRQEPEPDIRLVGMAVSREKITAHSTVTARVKAVNRGGAEGSLKIPLKVNGRTVDAKRVTLKPRKTGMVDFQVFIKEPGSYTLDAGGLTTTIEVTPVKVEISVVPDNVSIPRGGADNVGVRYFPPGASRDFELRVDNLPPGTRVSDREIYSPIAVSIRLSAGENAALGTRRVTVTAENSGGGYLDSASFLLRVTEAGDRG